ncbi:hypothetical protein N7481_012526 [Penicillium waksmanii]|uniref:uncharacterized protein n=1 Tax=Penicillium waksmanii TaxID=69791 RepID=UPI0025489CAA|nr:uncharacterized protein N7481_012526 [Penicillium waksmanii]KAJ5965812.1 hypothetical protein N7481_012526 [Penicillium waksmanii]
MHFTFPTTAGILALSATIAQATTFVCPYFILFLTLRPWLTIQTLSQHNKDTAYTINVAQKDGSTSYVGPSSSIEIPDGWAYIRVCQPQKAGDWFVCKPGEVTWADWYGEVFWYLGGLTDASGMFFFLLFPSLVIK